MSCRHQSCVLLFTAFAIGLTLPVLTAHGAQPRGGGRGQQQDRQQDRQGGGGREPTAAETALADSALTGWLEKLPTTVPTKAADFATQNLKDFTEATFTLEAWAFETTRFSSDPERPTSPARLLQTVEHLLVAKDQVDRLLNQTLDLRAGLADLSTDKQRDAILHFLSTTSGLIDLSGRLRYMLFDVVSYVADEIDDSPAERDRLIEMLAAHKSSVGAMVAANQLIDPPPEAPAASGAEAGSQSPPEPAPQPAPPAVKRKVLELIAATGQMDLVPQLAEYARNPKTPPDLLLAAAETIRAVGLPQDLRPGQDPEVPKPSITAHQLHDLLAKVPADAWQESERPRVAELLAWLDTRAKKGLTEDRLRMGSFEVQPGDWLLMRNPSPYNLFTDLSPGLFTHVGVVAEEVGKDGIRRFVLVDLPERGKTMPATNVDAFVNRSLHYVFMRHPDPEVARKMAKTAGSLIGNPTEFDLNFRTDRVTEMKGKPLVGKKIHAYCAGFLLLCGQETGQPREEFFPVHEAPAGGNTRANLAKIGITFGDNFISPTGALFSTKMQIIGRREPMYDAQREVEEAIYDHFAESLKNKQLVPSPDLFQSLRLKLTEASRDNPLLAKAIADAANVDKDLDLFSAAKTQAVVETLDEIAYGNSGEFVAARQAIMDGPAAKPAAKGPEADAAAKVAELRQRHPRVTEMWDKQQLAPRGVRIELVKYYIQRGKEQLDARFFSEGKEPAAK